MEFKNLYSDFYTQNSFNLGIMIILKMFVSLKLILFL